MVFQNSSYPEVISNSRQRSRSPVLRFTDWSCFSHLLYCFFLSTFFSESFEGKLHNHDLYSFTTLQCVFPRTGIFLGMSKVQVSTSALLTWAQSFYLPGFHSVHLECPPLQSRSPGPGTTFSCHAFLASFNLEHFPSHLLSFVTLSWHFGEYSPCPFLIDGPHFGLV